MDLKCDVYSHEGENFYSFLYEVDSRLMRVIQTYQYSNGEYVVCRRETFFSSDRQRLACQAHIATSDSSSDENIRHPHKIDCNSFCCESKQIEEYTKLHDEDFVKIFCIKISNYANLNFRNKAKITMKVIKVLNNEYAPWWNRAKLSNNVIKDACIERFY